MGEPGDTAISDQQLMVLTSHQPSQGKKFRALMWCCLLWEQGVSKELEVLDTVLIPEHPLRPRKLLAGQEDQALLSASVWLDHQHFPRLVPSCLYFSPSRV